MDYFNGSGKLTPKKCIGVVHESQHRASWIIYIKDSPGGSHHFSVEVSYMEARGVRKNAIKYAKQRALEKGYDLVEII